MNTVGRWCIVGWRYHCPHLVDSLYGADFHPEFGGICILNCLWFIDLINHRDSGTGGDVASDEKLLCYLPVSFLIRDAIAIAFEFRLEVKRWL